MSKPDSSNYVIEDNDQCKYVKANYSSLYEEAKKDFIGFLLKNSNEFVYGFEKQRKLVAYFAVTGFLNYPRMNLMLVGKPGVGKTTVAFSILRQFPEDSVRIATTIKCTKSFLRYIFNNDVDSLDVNTIYVDSFDKKIRDCIWFITEYVENPPAFITTTANVYGTTGIDYKIFFKEYMSLSDLSEEDDEKIAEMILDSDKEIEYSPEIRAVVKCILSEIPKTVEISDEVADTLVDFSEKMYNYIGEQGYSIRAIKRFRNLTIVRTAINFKTVTDINDLKAVMNEFRYDVLLDALDLTRSHVELMKYVKEAKTGTISEIINLSWIAQPYVEKMLKELDQKGFIKRDKKGKETTWSLTELGHKILEFIEKPN